MARPPLRGGLLLAAVLALAGALGSAAHATQPRTVTAQVTAADRAAARHMIVRYLHLSPSAAHPQATTELAAVPRIARAPAAPRPPTPVATFDPNHLSYDADTGGPVLTAARIHNVFVNCPGSGPTGDVVARCWGTVGNDPHSVPTPDQFASDFAAGGPMHVTDQYVGSTASGRYTVGPDVNIRYSISNSQASFQDVISILTTAVSTLGPQYAGYNDMYLLYFPVGIDVCTPSACVSGGTFCSFHSSADGTIKGMPVHVVFAAEPYQDIPNCRIILGPNEVNDSTASNIAHELAEMITNPDGDAWHNVADGLLAGNEMADECDRTKFIRYPTLTLPKATAGNKYKIQLLYSNSNLACVDAP